VSTGEMKTSTVKRNAPGDGVACFLQNVLVVFTGILPTPSILPVRFSENPYPEYLSNFSYTRM